MQNQKIKIETRFFDICTQKHNKVLFSHLLDIADPDVYRNNEKLLILKWLCYSDIIRSVDMFEKAVNQLKPDLNKTHSGITLLTHLVDRCICDYKYSRTYNKDLYKRYLPIISYMLSREDVDVSAQNMNGRTVLHDLWLDNYDGIKSDPVFIDLEKMLLDAGAQYNTVNKKGQTLLHLAVISKKPLRAINLVTKMKGIIFDKKDKKGQTPLDIAQENYRQEKDRYDKWKASKDNWYTLDYETVEERLKVVNLLKALTLEGL